MFRYLCTKLLITVLFDLTKSWTQPKCSQLGVVKATQWRTMQLLKNTWGFPLVGSLVSTAQTQLESFPGPLVPIWEPWVSPLNPDPSGASSYNWISMKPSQKFNSVWDPESSQMPSKENSQEDTASCHHSFSEMLIEGLHNLTLSPSSNYTRPCPHPHPIHTPKWLLQEQDIEEEMQHKRPLEQQWLLWTLKD